MKNIGLYKHIIYSAYRRRFTHLNPKNYTYRFFNSNTLEQQKDLLTNFYNCGGIENHFKIFIKLLTNISFVDWIYCPVQSDTNLIYLAPFINDLIEEYYNPYSVDFSIDSNSFPNENSLADILYNANKLLVKKDDTYLKKVCDLIKRIDNKCQVQFTYKKELPPYSILEDVVSFIRVVYNKKVITTQDYYDFFESKFIDLQIYKNLKFNFKELYI